MMRNYFASPGVTVGTVLVAVAGLGSLTKGTAMTSAAEQPAALSERPRHPPALNWGSITKTFTGIAIMQLRDPKKRSACPASSSSSRSSR